MTLTPTSPLTLAELAPMYRALAREQRHRRVWLYAIQQGEGGAVKLGQAKRPCDRLSTLQQANSVELKGLAAWRAFPEEEKALHEEFAHIRIRGEWFEPAPELIEYVLSEGGSFCDWTPLTVAEKEAFAA